MSFFKHFLKYLSIDSLFNLKLLNKTLKNGQNKYSKLIIDQIVSLISKVI